jgi:hypothetical protein
MRWKPPAVFAFLCLLIAAAGMFAAQTQTPTNPATPATAPKPRTPVYTPDYTVPAPNKAGQPAPADGSTPQNPVQPAHITVANPPVAPPQPVPWTLPERVAWAANLVLVVFAYVGIMLAIWSLRKVEQLAALADAAAESSRSAMEGTQATVDGVKAAVEGVKLAIDGMRSAVEAAQASARASAETSQAALLYAQSIVQAERPWVLVSVEPTLGAENSFTVTATNRGRSPARITAVIDAVAIAADEGALPKAPEFAEDEKRPPMAPLILLPGESAGVKVFAREDAKTASGNEEAFKKVENWEEKLYLFGRILYNDLLAPPGKEGHQTGWCCWYIHGRQKSGLVSAGPPEYNAHT